MFFALCSELLPFLRSARNTRAISVEIKLLTALSLFATGSYQRLFGQNYNFGLSQKSVSSCVREVTMAFDNPVIVRKYIQFPLCRLERQTIVNGFFNKFNFPGILGCIDGTHVALVKPSVNEEWFLNRKGYHSRNVQIICDSDLRILNVDASYGGSTHDSFIWRNSVIQNYMKDINSGTNRCWFLGDSGYAQRKYLMTPMLNTAVVSPEAHYTARHCTIRNTVERCIGVLKCRWRCLLLHRVLHYDQLWCPI